MTEFQPIPSHRRPLLSGDVKHGDVVIGTTDRITGRYQFTVAKTHQDGQYRSAVLSDRDQTLLLVYTKATGWKDPRGWVWTLTRPPIEIMNASPPLSPHDPTARSVITTELSTDHVIAPLRSLRPGAGLLYRGEPGSLLISFVIPREEHHDRN